MRRRRAGSTDGLGLCVAGQSRIIPVAFSDDSSGCVVAWCDFRSGAAFDIYAQRVSSAGAIATGWPANGAALCTAGGSQIDPLLVRDGSGGAIVAWNDGRSNGDVYGTRVSGAGVVGEVTTAVEMALVGADATPDRDHAAVVRVDPRRRGHRARRRRRRLDLRREASPDASGLVRWEDRDVAPEHRYGYRIVVRDGADERRFGAGVDHRSLGLGARAVGLRAQSHPRADVDRPSRCARRRRRGSRSSTSRGAWYWRARWGARRRPSRRDRAGDDAPAST